jgi:hypothetical protein
MIELVFNLLKITSFRHRQITQQHSYTYPDQTFQVLRLIIKPSTKQMANGSGLVKISSEEDYLPNCFSKGAVKE